MNQRTFSAIHLVPCPAGYAIIDNRDGHIVVEGLTQPQAFRILTPIEPKGVLFRGPLRKGGPAETDRARYTRQYHEWLETAER